MQPSPTKRSAILKRRSNIRWKNVCALREEAISLLAENLRSALQPIWQELGADPLAASREDAAYAFDALHAALECAQSDAFLDYIDWLQQVLASRGGADLLQPALMELEDLFGLRLTGAERDAVTALLSETRARLEDERDAPLDYGGSGPEEAWKHPGGFQEALLAGDHRRSAALFEEGIARSGNHVLTAVHLLQPALYEIGRKWQCNAVSVTQERLATAIAEAVLAQASGQTPPAAASDRCVVLARAPGNHHALGMRIVADAFEMEGWETLLLNGPASSDELLPILREKRPQLLGFSAALPPQLLAVRELLRQLREALGDAMPRVILGGLAVNQYPEVARSMGGDIVGKDAGDLQQVMAELERAA
jgi:methanogenic corrinoid protein MtbC1